jgi:hypothetical protein
MTAGTVLARVFMIVTTETLVEELDRAGSQVVLQSLVMWKFENMYVSARA